MRVNGARAPSLNILVARIGKILVGNRGDFCKKTGKTEYSRYASDDHVEDNTEHKYQRMSSIRNTVISFPLFVSDGTVASVLRHPLDASNRFCWTFT